MDGAFGTTISFYGMLPLPMCAVYHLLYTFTGIIIIVAVWLSLRAGIHFAGWIYAALFVAVALVQEHSWVGQNLSLAYTQAGVDPVTGIAALGGPYLIVFCMSLASGTAALLLVKRDSAALTAAVCAAVVLGAALVAGSINAPRIKGVVRVAAVAHRMPDALFHRWMDMRESTTEEVMCMLGKYEASTRRAAGEGARLIVWPNFALVLHDRDMAAFTARLISLARDTGAVIAAGYSNLDTRRNQSMIVLPTGETYVYTKMHLMPHVETSLLVAGTIHFGLVGLNYLGVTIAVQMCGDNNFPFGARMAALAGADIIINHSMDRPANGERMAMFQSMRSAENHMAMVRSAGGGGMSALVDPSGRITARESMGHGDTSFLVGNVPIASSGTFYSRAGNWIVIVSGMMLLAFLVRIFRNRGKR
jgi:apolipoprotein N-acyltransferase